MTELIAIAAGLVIGLGALGSANGIGQVGAKLVESVARQPQAANDLQMRFFIAAGLLDAIPMIAVAIGLLLLFANPLAS